MINTVITLPYELARKPLAVADERLSDKLPEALGSRVGWALGSADKVAGTLLRNPDIAQRGTDRVERANKLLTASRLETEAEARRLEADRVADAGIEEAARKREAAEDRAESGLEEADEAERRGKQAARERAQQTADAKQASAQKRAAARKAAAESRKEQVTSIADAQQRNAQERAKAELADADEERREADEARADAERLAELTETKKQARKQD
jgi:hypothetical protein